MRPLLRLEIPIPIDAREIKDAGFSGAIFPAQIATKEILAFAKQCRAANLGFWLDLSRLHAPNETLHKQHLVFRKNQPHFELAYESLLDTLHPQSGSFAVQILESFQDETSLLSGVISQTIEVSGSTFPHFPWSPGLPQSFLARHNFNILHRIETLVASGGDEASRVRQQYWDEIHLAREENFYAPIRRWCKKRGLQFCARNFKPEWHALALDSILRARLDGAAIALKNISAFPASLSEEGNHVREFHRLLRSGAFIFEREYSADINTAPNILLNEIMARAAGIFAGSHDAAKVGVLFPARSSQTHYHPDGHRFTRWVGEDLKLVTDLLDSLHFDWMFVFEDQIVDAAREGSTLCAGVSRHAFEMIILPSMTALSWQAWQTLEAFADGGGKVACLGLLPRWSERGRDHALEKLIGKDSRLIIEDLYQAYDALEGNAPMPPTIGYPVFREYHSGGRLCCYQPRLNADSEDARLRVRQILHESLSPNFETLSENISYAHRITHNGATEKSAIGNSNLFFVLNEGKETSRVNARLRPLAATENLSAIEFDASNGQSKILPVLVPYSPDEGGGIGITFELAPGQARFVEVRCKPDFKGVERARFEVEWFDGETASGWMTQNGTPQIAVRQNGKIVWHASEEVIVPAPLLLDANEWHEATQSGQREYSQSVTIPIEWKNCRVYLEVAQPQNAMQCLLNEGDAGLKISSPFRFDVTLLLAFGASNDFALRFWNGESSDEYDDAPIARLVAYPVVAVKITP